MATTYCICGFSLFDAAVIVVQILRGMGTSYDTVYHAEPEQLKAICESIILMHGEGCWFADDQITRMVEGEEDEA